MSVKLEDIAKETGFSISTVSRVLSNSNYPVSDQIHRRPSPAERDTRGDPGKRRDARDSAPGAAVGSTAVSRVRVHGRAPTGMCDLRLWRTKRPGGHGGGALRLARRNARRIRREGFRRRALLLA